MNYTTYKSMIEELDKWNMITTAERNFIKSHTIKSIDDEIERLRKLKNDEEKCNCYSCKSDYGNCVSKTINQAIDDQISYWKEQKKLISEE